MTDKNLTAIRTFMQSDAWRALHHLPHVLIAEAKEASYSAPTKAAVRAQMAVAIGILNVAPIRRGNLGTFASAKISFAPADRKRPIGSFFRTMTSKPGQPRLSAGRRTDRADRRLSVQLSSRANQLQG